MGRPKGSKNKPKAATVENIKTAAREIEKLNMEEPVQFTTKADVSPAIPVHQKPEEWKPSPDMGHIKPPAKADALCTGCHHIARMHYGGSKNWCNLNGCSCGAFKE